MIINLYILFIIDGTAQNQFFPVIEIFFSNIPFKKESGL